MKTINLTQDKTAIVDDEDFETVSCYKWFYHHNGYAVRNDYSSGKHKTVHMHRVINNTPDGFETDHINGDKLDNRRENLRTATRSQNRANMKNATNKTGLPKGIRFRPTFGKYQVRIKQVCLGSFSELSDAIAAYNAAAVAEFGEFSSLISESSERREV